MKSTQWKEMKLQKSYMGKIAIANLNLIETSNVYVAGVKKLQSMNKIRSMLCESYRRLGSNGRISLFFVFVEDHDESPLYGINYTDSTLIFDHHDASFDPI